MHTPKERLSRYKLDDTGKRWGAKERKGEKETKKYGVSPADQIVSRHVHKASYHLPEKLPTHDIKREIKEEKTKSKVHTGGSNIRKLLSHS